MGTVTWDEVFGADSYRATAMDGNGTTLSCTSTSTSCQITMLKCGEVYLVSVTAISDACENTSNYTASFQTGELALKEPFTREGPEKCHLCRK